MRNEQYLHEVVDGRRGRYWVMFSADLERLAEHGVDADGIAIFTALHYYANKHADIHPSLVTIGRMAGMSRPTVQRKIGQLVAAGVLEIETRFADDGRQTSNRYRLTPNDWTGNEKSPGGGISLIPPPHQPDTHPVSGRFTNKPVVNEPGREQRGSNEPQRARGKTTKPAPPTPEPTKPRRIAYAEDFEAFWRAYDRPGDTKKQAATEYAKLTGDERAAALAALPAWKASEQWQRDGGKYQPYALRWLRDRRWEDAPPPPPNGLGANGKPLQTYLGQPVPPEIAAYAHNDHRRLKWEQAMRDQRDAEREAVR